MRSRMVLAITALVLSGAVAAQAQSTTTSSRRIRVQKDVNGTSTGTEPGVVASSAVAPMDTLVRYRPLANTCSSVDVSAARGVQIKSNLYNPSTMISPDSAKVIALCAVPGQIGSGEMNVANGNTEYAIDIIPNHRKTHTKVIVDAQTGDVISSKQFGGLRGLSGWVRESAEHKENVKKAARDSVPQL